MKMSAFSYSLLLMSVSGSGQTPARPAFEAASVKSIALGGPIALDFRLTPGRLTVTGLTLRSLIQEAYGVQYYQIVGGPGWLDTDRFDIVAKAEGTPSRDQIMQMLQVLLENRFKLAVRRDAKEGTVYALTVAKGGPKLKEAQKDERSMVYVARTGSNDGPAVTLILHGDNVSMPLLIERLKGTLRTPVLDRTGIADAFSMRVEYAADDTQVDSGPSLFTALQEQLGLKLESTKGPVETLVIDRVEKLKAEN